MRDKEILRKIACGTTDAEKLRFTEQALHEAKRQYAILLAEYRQMQKERGELIDAHQRLYRENNELLAELGRKEDEDVL